MNDVNLLYFLKSYIKDHKKVVIFFVLATIIFLVIVKLYRLPLAAVGYAAVLCLVLGLLFFIYDFYFYQKLNKELMAKFMSISETTIGLPGARSFTEQNYENLLVMSCGASEEKQNRVNRVMTEMMDYYTMWAHQIKTPIAAMKLVLQSNGDKMSSGIRQDLNGELFKIEQYVEMVLSYMRLESETTDYVIKEYDLDDIIKQTVKKFSSIFINKKIKMDFRETGLIVLTDEKWLSFAIEQILSNAVKYTEQGTVTIKAKPEASDTEVDGGKDSAMKELIIEDTGIGIAPEDLPRVFEKGYTGYNGRVEKKSTGIGLFLTKMILSRLGHNINIESDLGRGTTVTLDLSDLSIELE